MVVQEEPLPRPSETVLLWSGGKDSALALQACVDRIGLPSRLVTLAPSSAPEFRAHPIAVLREQARRLGLPHDVLAVPRPYDTGYEAVIGWMRDAWHIRTLVTGDIDLVEGQPSWIAARARAVGLATWMPLFGLPRAKVLARLQAHGLRVVLSYVDTRFLDASWLGRELDASAVEQLLEHSAATGMDPCGEQGEYHSLVLDGPLFTRPVSLRGYMPESMGTAVYLRRPLP